MKTYIIKKRIQAESVKEALEKEATAEVSEVFVEDPQSGGSTYALGFSTVGEPD